MSVRCLDVLVCCYYCAHIFKFCFFLKVTLLNHLVCSGIILSAKWHHVGWMIASDFHHKHNLFFVTTFNELDLIKNGTTSVLVKIWTGYFLNMSEVLILVLALVGLFILLPARSQFSLWLINPGHVFSSEYLCMKIFGYTSLMQQTLRFVKPVSRHYWNKIFVLSCGM